MLRSSAGATHKVNIQKQAEFAIQIARRLKRIYKNEFNEATVNKIIRLCTDQINTGLYWNEKDIILITYGNVVNSSGEKPLKTLLGFLKSRISGVFSFIHILPFFPSSSDDGFAVKNFFMVDPLLGTWDDIDAISGESNLMADLVINHVSASHPWFRDFLAGVPKFSRFFIEQEQGIDYSGVTRPRNSPLFTRFNTASGEKYIWTTFSADQVDLNFSNADVLVEIIRVLLYYLSKKIKIIRLDAVAYIWKRNGTSCIHLPEAHEIIKLLRDIASYVGSGTIILTETNVPNMENWSYFGANDEAHMVYQFTLPPLLLFTLLKGNANLLTRWTALIPEPEDDQTFLNFTASHDGIGVRPIEDMIDREEMKIFADSIRASGGLISTKTNTDGSQAPYEFNITYFDALRTTFDGNSTFHESRFICSQIIMMAMKGIPAFYFQNLFAYTNDYEGVNQCRKARAINRKRFTKDELTALLTTNTVHQKIFGVLIKAIEIRKSHPAFHPGANQQIMNISDRYFGIIRKNEKTGEIILCIANVSSKEDKLKYSEIIPEGSKPVDILSEGEIPVKNNEIVFLPYQVRWVKI